MGNVTYQAGFTPHSTTISIEAWELRGQVTGAYIGRVGQPVAFDAARVLAEMGTGDGVAAVAAQLAGTGVTHEDAHGRQHILKRVGEEDWMLEVTLDVRDALAAGTLTGDDALRLAEMDAELEAMAVFVLVAEHQEEVAAAEAAEEAAIEAWEADAPAREARQDRELAEELAADAWYREDAEANRGRARYIA